MSFLFAFWGRSVVAGITVLCYWWRNSVREVHVRRESIPLCPALPQKLENNNFVFLRTQIILGCCCCCCCDDGSRAEEGRNAIASLRCIYPNVSKSKEAFIALGIVEVFLLKMGKTNQKKTKYIMGSLRPQTADPWGAIGWLLSLCFQGCFNAVWIILSRTVWNCHFCGSEMANCW